MTQIMTEVWMTPDEAASYLRVRKATLAMWRATGKGPRFRKLSQEKPGHVRYRQRDVDDWLMSDGKESAAE